VSRRRRGFETEELVAQALRDDGWPHADVPARGAGGRDVTGTPGLCWEVKARNGFDPGAWTRQAVKNAGPLEVPIVVMRPNGMGEASINLWPMFIPFGDGRRLLRLAGYGSPTEEPTWIDTTTFGDLARGVRRWARRNDLSQVREEPIDGA
jgi:hypothetical protein